MSTHNNQDDIDLARSHLATFFRAANKCMDCGHWFSIRGNCRESLVRFMSVLITDYAATLYVAKLVSVNKKGDVTLLRDEWDKFLRDSELDENGSQSVAEANISKIDCRRLMEESSRPKERFRREIFFVRVGAYPPGESGNASDQIQADIPPPETTIRYRSVQRRFTLAMSDLLDDYRDLPAVAAVSAWVEWKEVVDYAVEVESSSESEQESDDEASAVDAEEEVQAVETETVLQYKEPIIATNELPISTNTDSPTLRYPLEHPFATKYPLLNEYHRNVLDRGESTAAMLSRFTMDNMLREIVQFKKDHDEPLTYTSTNSKKKRLLVEVPQVEEAKFFKKAKSTKWLDTLFQGCTTSNSASSGAKSILEYIIKRYRTDFESVLSENGLLPKIMNEFQVMALMKLCGFGVSKFRRLKQALRTFLGIDTLCVPESKYRVLGDDHGEIDVGTYLHSKGEGLRKEKMDWWTRDALGELKRKVKGYINSLDGFKVEDIDFIFSVYGGDHGCGKFRFVTKLIIDMKDGSSKEYIYQLAEIDCKKDSSEVLMNTIGENIINGINAVEDCSLRFVYDEAEKKWDVESIDKSDAGNDPLFKEPVTYLCGDLAYLFMILGKEGCNTWWCYCLTYGQLKD